MPISRRPEPVVFAALINTRRRPSVDRRRRHVQSSLDNVTRTPVCARRTPLTTTVLNRRVEKNAYARSQRPMTAVDKTIYPATLWVRSVTVYAVYRAVSDVNHVRRLGLPRLVPICRPRGRVDYWKPNGFRARRTFQRARVHVTDGRRIFDYGNVVVNTHRLP